MEGSISDQELAEAILLASRAMVGVAVRSLSAADHQITLPQYRTLVVLVYRGHQRLGDLATNLGVSPSTATRMCDRLVRKGLITRSRDTIDRREVNLAVTDEGRRLVQMVMERRRQEVEAMVSSIPAGARARLVNALQLLSEAAGEVPEMHWAPGWRIEQLTDDEPPADTATVSNPESGSKPSEEVRPPSG